MAASASPGTVESVLAHPPYATYYLCGEHRKGELQYIGDDLGTDCFVERLIAENGRTWARAHEDDGTRNEHWFGWKAALLSPCECKVEAVKINPVVNEPGHLGKPPASMIIFKRDDGVRFLMAHVQDVSVAAGDSVAYGQPVAKVGNNGYGRIPHVHMGAWKDKTALQIRWDTSIPVGGAHHAE
jgi:hypothetical protein